MVADVPYAVTEQRPQVRLIEAQGRSPVVMPSTVESRVYHYERIASDPVCHQQITLEQDDYGFVSKAVSINYPRRAKGRKILISITKACQKRYGHQVMTNNNRHYV